MLKGAARTARDCTTVPLTRRVGVTRELLQRQASGCPLFVAALGIARRRFQFRMFFFAYLATSLSRLSSRSIKAILATGHLSS